MKRLILILVILLVGAAGLVLLPAVQDRLIASAVAKRMDNSERHALFDDQHLRLLVCGSASPLPAPDRARPCLAVIAGDKFYVVDTGPGSWNRMALLRIPGERIGGVFLTHFHSDHIGDLGEFNMQTWVAGRPEPLTVHGPPGVERIVAGYSEAYAQDVNYRIAHHGEALLDRELGAMQAQRHPVPPAGEAREILRDGELRVSQFAVSHDPVRPAVGYRFDYRGRSIVISGDTRKDETLATLARGVDVLAHEAQNQRIVRQMHAVSVAQQRPRLSKIFTDIPDYHTSPVEAAEIANAADAGLLLLYHLTPPPPNRIAEMAFMRGVQKVREAPTVLSHDGTLISIPLDGGPATVSRL